MGLRAFLFGKPLLLEDEVFGRLRYYGTPKSEEGYWEGETRFTAAGYTISLAIDAPQTGPAASQKAFYREVEARYPELLPAVQQLIAQEFQHWETNPQIWDFIREFWPVHISLPAMLTESGEPDWELAFETTHDINHTFTVSLQGFRPYAVLVDG